MLAAAIFAQWPAVQWLGRCLVRGTECVREGRVQEGGHHAAHAGAEV